MPRFAFVLEIRPEAIGEYVARHAPVWPEMLAEIHASGRRNYSLFLDRERRLLFGFYETDDDEAARAHLTASSVAARWEESMSAFFVGLSGRPDEAAAPLSEVFNLDDQLNAIRPG